MKQIKPILEKILLNFQNNLPPLLDKYGVKQFDGYSIGFPVDPKKTCLCIRVSDGSDDGNNIRFSFDVELYLPGIIETEAYIYIDILNEYLNGFNPDKVGFISNSYSFLIKDDERLSALRIYWSAELSAPKDDCY